MDIDEDPPNIICDFKLSINLLAKIPLKKRLEILFAATIIPSRRQLAVKYDLSEQEIHNVLSHRQYLLQNWQYNANSEDLLTKRDLENAMAMTELLIEWKRRVQLNGLQITDAALTRKGMLLLRILNANNLKLTEDWWNQFNLNWDYKQFRDSENDSLEMEDILCDLKWLFSDAAFGRLTASFRQYKSNRTGVSMPTGADKELDSSDLDEFINISFIKADPHYYNDDHFDCEDYELVLDEDIVVDALRKEIQDYENAKFQLCMQDAENEHEHVTHDGPEQISEQDLENDHVEDQEENQEMDQSQNEEITEENDLTAKDEIEEKLYAMFHEVSSPKSHENKEDLVQTIPVHSKPVTIVQRRRKTRNRNAVMSLRKDYVRLTASSDISSLVRNDSLQLLERNSENSNDDDDNEEDEDYTGNITVKKRGRKRKIDLIPKSQPKTTKRKYKSRKINDHSQTMKQLPEFSNSINCKEESQLESEESFEKTIANMENSNGQAIELPLCDVKEEVLSPTNSDEEFLISEDKKSIKIFNHGTNNTTSTITTATTSHLTSSYSLERNNNITTSNTKANSDNQIDNMVAVQLGKNVRRSNRGRFDKSTRKIYDNLGNETILGGSYSYEDERIQRAAIVAAQNLEENQKLLQDLLDPQGDEPDVEVSLSPRKPLVTKGKPGRKPKQTQLKNKQASQQETFVPPTTTTTTVTKFKRSKRRTDASDITLRKDKVRISLVPTINDKKSKLEKQELGVNEDIQMIYEPYVGED